VAGGRELLLTMGRTMLSSQGPDGIGMTDLGSLVNLPTGFAHHNATAIHDREQLVTVAVAVPSPRCMQC
jgi:hypothetical protein